MVNRNNIVEYISFLHQKKLGQAAPQELLDSWTGLDDNDTIIHLYSLYKNWNLDTNITKRLEQEFLGREKAKLSQSRTVASQGQKNTSGANKFLIEIFVTLIVTTLIIGYCLWIYISLNRH